jgi:hypothetical protein
MELNDVSQFIRHRAGKALIGPPERFVSGLTFVGLRKNGRKLATAWFGKGSLWQLLGAELDKYPDADFFELCCTQGVRNVEPEKWETALINRASGRYGLQLTLPDRVFRVSPTEMIAQNRSPQRFFAWVLDKSGFTPEQFFVNGGGIELLEMSQFFGFLPAGRAVAVHRGNVLVAADGMEPKLVEDTIEGMGRWFMANIGSDGGIPYKYWPSRGEYSQADNTIRRFMATIALNRLGLDRQDPEILKAARRNLEFNLARFYKVEKGFGLIDWDGSVKLGAVALAALAILESPDADKFAEPYDRLRRTIDELWKDDGSFRTFYRPADRNDNQNFYPGEALLLLASELETDRREDVLEKALKSVEYYREWHMQNRNPAFIPWHVMACAKLYRLTGRKDLADYVFEMSDWLLDHQQWGGNLDPDLWGRFYTPGKPYGPPHASSTGVFMEGMVDAMLVARDAGDSDRAETYETSIWRGARSIRQLQFKDEVDTFYISKKARALGAVRTEAYNNEIRVDNIQHALMALLRFQHLAGHAGISETPADQDLHQGTGTS